MNNENKFEVLKMVTVILSKNEEELIFKDSGGRIYFIDKKNSGGYENISIDDNLLVWVRKEVEKVGFISLMVNNKTVEEFVTTLEDRGIEFYSSIETHGKNDVVRLSNYMYNSDIEFNKALEFKTCSGCIIGNYDKTTTAITELIMFYESVGINSELAEFKYELGILHTYFYNLYKEGV